MNLLMAKLKDLRVDYYKSGGPGGQHKNKRFMAVRVTHLPTGTIAVGQKERSQEANKKLAFERLSEKLSRRSIKRKRRIPTRAPKAAREIVLAGKRVRSLKKLMRRKKINIEES